jgi:hypothetical protein
LERIHYTSGDAKESLKYASFYKKLPHYR